MGQKISPRSLRIGGTATWESQWFAGKRFATPLSEDLLIRRTIESLFPNGAISKILIIRSKGEIKVAIETGRPGVIIGRGGAGLRFLRAKLERELERGHGPKRALQIDVIEIKQPDLDARLVAQHVAGQVTRRFPYKRAVKQAIERALQAGAEGIRIRIAGRLAGAEISRAEKYQAGKLPLATLSEYIDYGTAIAKTTYGVIGVKVWIYAPKKGTPEEIA